MEENRWLEPFRHSGALWIHDGNPSRPHALLTSGNHSNGFFNGSMLLQDPQLMRRVGITLMEDIGYRLKSDESEDITRVVGSAFGAITLAHECAGYIDAMTGFTEPVIMDGAKSMMLKRFPVQDGEVVLVVEDVFTTGGTTLKTIAALEAAGAKVVPYVGVIVNRSGLKELERRQVVALVDREMPMWPTKECPLCKEGSEAIRPKGNEAWQRLNAAY